MMSSYAYNDSEPLVCGQTVIKSDGKRLSACKLKALWRLTMDKLQGQYANAHQRLTVPLVKVFSN